MKWGNFLHKETLPLTQEKTFDSLLPLERVIFFFEGGEKKYCMVVNLYQVTMEQTTLFIVKPEQEMGSDEEIKRVMGEIGA